MTVWKQKMYDKNDTRRGKREEESRRREKRGKKKEEDEETRIEREREIKR